MTVGKHRVISIIFYIFAVYLFFFLLKAPAIAAASVSTALKVCFTKAIPALFPFLVLNELLISSGLSDRLAKYIGPFVSKVFKIKKVSSSALLSGCLFGFPLGTKTSVSLYENNAITKKEAERLICFCSNTGPAFVIGVIGTALENIKIALCIYISQIISAFIIGLATRNKSDGTLESFCTTQKAFSFSAVPKAVTDSVIPMLNICAFICFFSCISSSVDNMLSYFNLSEYASVFLSGFLEITNGINRTVYMGVNLRSIILCSFFVGWSGLSVILQSLSFTAKHKLNVKDFIFAKLIQGLLCAFISVILCKLFKLY